MGARFRYREPDTGAWDKAVAPICEQQWQYSPEAVIAPRDRIEQALRNSARMQTERGHPTGCMVTLSATICSDESAPLQAATAAERRSNRAAIAQCVASAVADGDLRQDTNVLGMAAMIDGLLNGLSIQTRDGVPRADLEVGISAAMQAWDANRCQV